MDNDYDATYEEYFEEAYQKSEEDEMYEDDCRERARDMQEYCRWP